MPTTSPRSEKLDLRLTPQAKQRIVAAADVLGRSVSDFVLTSALERADEALAENSVWNLTAEQWEAFHVALDAPPVFNPALRKLLSEPSVFDTQVLK